MRSYSNSKLHPKGLPSKMFVDFGDPLDVTMIQRNALHWSYRAYVEAKDCFAKGDYSFVLFDTLTYDDDHLTYYHDVDHKMLFQYWDYPCFCRSDIQKFLKILRKRLHYLGFDVARNLRYLITSEYGSSQDGTHRPHYHCLFFVSFDIDPIFFSSIVHSAWPCIHDGYPDKDRLYVLNERVFRRVDNHSLNVFNYVCKYITKDLYTYEKLSRRAYWAFTCTYPDWQKSSYLRDEFKRFKSNVLNFHLQSLHFGESALKDTKSLERGFFLFTTPKSVLKVPLGTYYERKAYMHLEYINGSSVWCRNRNKDAFQYFWNKSQRTCRELAFNIKVFYGDALSDSQVYDIAQYHVYKRGLLIPSDMVNDSPKSIFELMYFSPRSSRLMDYFHTRISYRDKVYFGTYYAFISNYVLRDIFRFKYCIVDGVAKGRCLDNAIIHPRRNTPETLLFSRHWTHGSSIPVHERSFVNRYVCNRMHGSFVKSHPKVLLLDELLLSGLDGHVVYSNQVYDDILDQYYDHLNFERNLRKNIEKNNSALRYKMKTYACGN